MRRLASIALCAALASSDAQAGPWTKKWGELYVKLAENFFLSESFRDASGDLSESNWDGWPVLGPRTVRWCCRFIAEQSGDPRARHTKWCQECGLKLGDEGVREHELAMRTLEMATTYDQVNAAEVSALELLLWSAQLAELRHKQTLIDRRGDLSHGDDEHLYIGLRDARSRDDRA